MKRVSSLVLCALYLLASCRSNISQPTQDKPMMQAAEEAKPATPPVTINPKDLKGVIILDPKGLNLDDEADAKETQASLTQYAGIAAAALAVVGVGALLYKFTRGKGKAEEVRALEPKFRGVHENHGPNGSVTRSSLTARIAQLDNSLPAKIVPDANSAALAAVEQTRDGGSSLFLTPGSEASRTLDIIRRERAGLKAVQVPLPETPKASGGLLEAFKAFLVTRTAPAFAP